MSTSISHLMNENCETGRFRGRKPYERSKDKENSGVFMKLPDPEDIEFTSLAWKEWLLDGDKSVFRSKDRIFRFVKKCKKDGYFDRFSGIKNHEKNGQIRRLLNGYALLDLLDCSNAVQYLRFKMWRLFEDLVGEILDVALKHRKECRTVYVDKWPGFRGLDYVVVNSKDKLGWRVGVQCKRYVGMQRTYSEIDQCSSFTRGTSAAGLYKEGFRTKERFPKRKIVLVTFNAFRRNRREKNKFRNLKNAWDAVVVIDENSMIDDPYMYRLRCDKLYEIVDWC